MKSVIEGLTQKQLNFVVEYLKDSNATQAAIRAGYSVRTAGAIGFENLKKPEIAAEIARRQQNSHERVEVTTDYVLSSVVNVVERCLKDGKDFDPQAALKGLELLGRSKKMWTDKIEHRVDDVNKRTDEELAFYDEHKMWPEQIVSGKA